MSRDAPPHAGGSGQSASGQLPAVGRARCLGATIRTATEADIPTLRSLAQQIWRDYYPAIITPDQIEYMLEWMYAPEVIRSELAAGIVWELILREAEPVGFLAYGHEAVAREVTLHKVYVQTALHGQGLGQLALAHVKAKAVAWNARRIVLRVNKRNERAIRAYERAGFTVAETLVSNIGGGFVMDDYLMALAL